MDFGWVTIFAAALTAIVGAAYTLYLMLRESTALRRIERITELIRKLEPNAKSRVSVERLRDSMIEQYILTQTDEKRASIKLALTSLGFYLAGFACFGISVPYAFTAAWPVWVWMGVAFLVVGMILISFAERKLDSAKGATADARGS